VGLKSNKDFKKRIKKNMKNMEVFNYRIETNSSDQQLCIDLCPHDQKGNSGDIFFVGSFLCEHNCDYNKYTDNEKRIVHCAYLRQKKNNSFSEKYIYPAFVFLKLIFWWGK
jgi:uncharacterized protein YfaT (DUF1175 family)